jgi:hypothetical protein
MDKIAIRAALSLTGIAGAVVVVTILSRVALLLTILRLLS